MSNGTPNTLTQLWLRNAAILLVELMLLAISVMAAFIPMDNYNTAVNLAIAVMMAIVGLLFFMGLLHEGVILRLAAATGFTWLIIMFILTFIDYFTRRS